MSERREDTGKMKRCSKVGRRKLEKVGGTSKKGRRARRLELDKKPAWGGWFGGGDEDNAKGAGGKRRYHTKKNKTLSYSVTHTEERL